MCFVAHKTYSGRTGCLQLPKCLQIVEDGVENNRQDQVPGAVLVPAQHMGKSCCIHSFVINPFWVGIPKSSHKRWVGEGWGVCFYYYKHKKKYPMGNKCSLFPFHKICAKWVVLIKSITIQSILKMNGGCTLTLRSLKQKMTY